MPDHPTNAPVSGALLSLHGHRSRTACGDLGEEQAGDNAQLSAVIAEFADLVRPEGRG